MVSVTWGVYRKRRGEAPRSSPPQSPAAPSPQQLGPYQLISLLGEGAMATVYQARDSRDGRILAIQLLSALHFAHKRHLFHRDIKPANIMLTRDGNAKIHDFDVAIEEGQSRFTNMGFSMGTPSHMAPEMLTHGVCDAHTDQYALGGVFYQILTGRCPFIHSNPMQLA